MTPVEFLVPAQPSRTQRSTPVLPNTLLRRALTCLLLSVAALLAPFQRSAHAETPPAQNRIIPGPLEDLGREYKVRLVYFVPKDREIKKDYREKIEVLMRVVRDVYDRDFKAKGYDTRGLDFEFDEDEKLKVHLIRARHNAEHYTGNPPTSDRLFNSTSNEMVATIGYPAHRACLVFSEAGGIAEATPAIPFCGVAMVSADMLRDEITASTIEKQIENMFDETPVKKADGESSEPRNRATQISNGVLMHELGHIFFMIHDQRDQRNIMAYGYHNLRLMFDKKTALSQPVRFSEDHARIAAATRFFSETIDEEDGEGPQGELKFLTPPQPGDTQVKFSFTASDNVGLKAVIYRESTLDTIIGGESLSGKTFERRGIFPRPIALTPGQLLHYMIYLLDENGNVALIQKDYRVPAEAQP